MSTVWDFEPDIPVRHAGPVDGRLPDPNPGGGGGTGLDLGVFAQIAVGLQSLHSSIERQQSRWEKAANSIPANYHNAQSGIYPATGNLLLDLGSAAQGTSWDVRQVIIGGSDITTTPAGTGWLIVSGSPPNSAGNNVPLAQVQDFTTGTLPQRGSYGTHELVVGAGEHLYVIVTSGTSGTQYVASCKCEVFDLGREASTAFQE